MLKLRTLTTHDLASILGWPAYPPEFADIDYALRSNGWLTVFWHKPDTWCFAVEHADELVGFSILSKTTESDAEFRIAIRADKIAQGLGGRVSNMTIAKGFDEINLSRIHLIVRKNNHRAIRLYQQLGFAEQGECIRNINGKQVQFMMMDMHRQKPLE